MHACPAPIRRDFTRGQVLCSPLVITARNSGHHHLDVPRDERGVRSCDWDDPIAIRVMVRVGSIAPTVEGTHDGLRDGASRGVAGRWVAEYYPLAAEAYARARHGQDVEAA